MTIGLGGIATNNISNTHAFANDRAFLVWGDNNGVLTFDTPIAGTELKTMTQTVLANNGIVDASADYEKMKSPVWSNVPGRHAALKRVTVISRIARTCSFFSPSTM